MENNPNQINIHELMQNGQFSDPHQFLGLKKDASIIRVWRPGSETVKLHLHGDEVEAKKIHEAGLFEWISSKEISPGDYLIFHQNGLLAHDPYAFDRVLGALDVHLLKRGLHYQLYNRLGATIKKHQGVVGTHFAVWAPNAACVSLVGDFNHWDGRVNPMRLIPETGVWEIFIPGLPENERYKYEILTRDGEKKIKADPVAHYTEQRPKTASCVFDIDRFKWKDAEWLKKRGSIRKAAAPLNIYEVHLGSWKQGEKGEFLNYCELAPLLAEYVKKMCYTHVELMGICEHPLDESWGYQVTGYFAPTSRHGTPEDFQYFVNYLHEKGIGVLLDWVPAHFPTDEHALYQFDGTYLYEHRDPRQGFHPHWNTHIFNYGRWEVSNFLIASAIFWIEKMHIDGLRFDAVTSMIYLDYGRGPGQWVPGHDGSNINHDAIEFMKHLNSIVHQKYEDVLLIAEESSLYPGITQEAEKEGLGFDLKWNLGWMNDTLNFFTSSFENRSSHFHKLIHVIDYAFDEKYALVLSHDEVVHEKCSLISKMPGGTKEKFAGARLLLSFMIGMPGRKLLFMGGEFGQWSEWNPKESIHWNLLEEEFHKKHSYFVQLLNHFYLGNPALWENDFDPGSFEWIHTSDLENCVISYLRKSTTQTLLFIHHLKEETLNNYFIPINHLRSIKEIFTTDREEFGGYGIIGELLTMSAEGIKLTLPPQSTQIFEIENH